MTLFSLTTYAQVVKPSSSAAENERDRFMCQHVEVTPDNKNLFLRENVRIETNHLFLRSDSAVFDNVNQTIVAYGTKEFIFNGGETIISDKATNTIRYKLGDKRIYLE